MINYERELKDCIIVLEEKKAMIKDLEEKNYDLERENKKLRSQLEEISELEKDVLILNKELEASNRICCNLENQKEELLSENKTLRIKVQKLLEIEKELVVAKNNLESLEKDFDRQLTFIEDKNSIIHDLLVSKSKNRRSVTLAKSNIVSTDDDTEVQQQSVGTKKAIIIGDSMIKEIIPEHLLPKKYSFQIQKHTVYHIDYIPGLINSLDDVKDNCTCVIHCSTNDITCLSADVIANKLKDFVNLALEKNPSMNVIISNIVPRG